jgi:cell cycle sensor histidine kinase DivJ
LISFTSSRAPGYLWLIASALAGLLGWLTGAPFALVLGVVALLWLPVLAAYMPPGWERESQAFQVLGWTVIAVLGVALTGGARSPLTILLVLGPLTGLAIGRRRLALEAAAFSTLGFFLLLAINFIVGLPQLPESLSGLAAAITIAAILETGMLCASAIVSQRRMASAVVKNELAMKQTEQGLNLRSGVQVPRDLPLALLSVTPQGRIRAIEGAVGLLGHLRVGALLHDSLNHLFPDLDLVALNRGAPQTVKTSDDRPVILLSRKTDNGRGRSHG